MSVDCGSSDKSNYTNSLTGPDIIWTPDTTLWPDIEEWSASFDNMNLPTNMTDEKQYSTLRYFPTNKALNQSKFCYTLRVIADNYYLIRASFWFGPLSMIYETHKDDQIRFHMIVDNYEGVEIVIDIPQKYPWFEEMYVRAQSSFVSVCLSVCTIFTPHTYRLGQQVTIHSFTLFNVYMFVSLNSKQFRLYKIYSQIWEVFSGIHAYHKNIDICGPNVINQTHECPLE